MSVARRRRAVGEPWTAEVLMRFVEVQKNGCWKWLGSRSGEYGKVSDPLRPKGERRIPAHRLSYELLVGPIPDGLHIDHLCRYRRCVNPDHLEPVTQAENNRRSGAAKTHCKRGHEFTPENTWFNRGGTWRYCKACFYLNREARKAA